MSNEFNADGGQNATVYVLLFGSGSNRGKVWNGSSFVTYATADRATYAISLTEQGTASGIYFGNFPTAITSGGTYEWKAYQQAGESPAEGDTLLNDGSEDWTGSASASSDASGSLTGPDWLAYVKRTFKRTDKDTEIYEATTDAIIVMRRRFGFDEAQVEMNTTDTISVAGDYKLNLESDFGLLQGVVLQDSSIAFPLVQLTKAEFDYIYPDAPINIYQGYPKHFCIYAGQILIGPIPDRQTYVYRLAYSKRAGSVTSSTTGVPFTNLYRDILKNATLWKLNETLEKFDTATYYKGEFALGYEEAVSAERKNRGDGLFSVRPILS